MEIQVKIMIKLIKGFIDGLITAIFLHYLVMGASDIVWSINSFLMWLKEIGVIK